MDNGYQCDTVFLDLSKAFDNVPHQLLIHKIQSFGICGQLLNWLKDYLSHRTQSVVCEGAKSAKKAS